jgi:hypothetical protein
MKKELIHPVFLSASKFTDDIFWKQIYEDLAYGKTPYGSYFSKGFFCCNFKNKEFSYKIDDKSPEKLYVDILNLLQNKLGVYSSSDKARRIADFEKLEKEIKDIRSNKWTNIKKKNARDFMIENYIVDMKNKYNIPDKELKKLHLYINVGIIFKTISHKDIIYEDGKIINIEGIDYKDNKIICKDLLENVEVGSVKLVFQEKKLLSDTWKKYLTTRTFTDIF